MGLFSKFTKKPEEPQTHTEPGMSGGLNANAVNQEFAGKEPGFNRPKNPLNTQGQIPKANPISNQHQSSSANASPESNFLASGPRGVNLSAPESGEINEQGASNSSAEISLSAPKEFVPSPRKVFAEQKPSKETSEKINSSQEQYRQIKRIRARRRLIGAVMLLALVVVTVPFLFDKEPPPPTVTIPLRIPNQNSVDIANIQVPGSPASATSLAAANTSEEAKNPATEADKTKSLPSNQNAVQPSKKEEKPQQIAKKTEPKKPEAKKPEPKKEPVKAQSPEPAKPAAAAAKGSYYIQVAAISNEARAKELLKKIQKAGIPGYVEPIAVKSGKVWRVRAGNFPNSKAAEDARARLGLLGLTGKVGQNK